jgi:hypothetical protein
MKQGNLAVTDCAKFTRKNARTAAANSNRYDAMQCIAQIHASKPRIDLGKR